MYEIGIASKDKARLAAGAMLLHSAGIKGSSSGNLFENGKPSATFASWLAGSAGSLHVQDGKAFGGSMVRKEGKYQIGFFNLDDPAGALAFVSIMGERATAVPRKTTWMLFNQYGNRNRDYDAFARGHAIHVGCTVTKADTIRDMIKSIEKGGWSTSWDLVDQYGHRSHYIARSEPAKKRIAIETGNVVVSLDQLREMLAAIT